MILWRAVAVLVCAVMLAGCLPVVSKTPLGTTAGLGADKALVGAWKGNNPDVKGQPDGFIHFLGQKTGTLRAVLVADVSDDDVMIFRTQTAKLGPNHYLNAVMTFDKDKLVVDGALKDANFPLLYVVKGRTLTLFQLDEGKVKAAIKAGKIKGTVEPGASGDAVITAEASELDAFFARPEAAGLFKPILVARRVE